MKLILSIVLVLLAAPVLPAQIVGRPPEESPFRDLQFRQDVTLFGGWYAAGDDPAGVAPTDAPMIGARYALRLAGPVSFAARAAYVFSERTVINPRLNQDERFVGVESWPLLLSDLSFTMNLTGQKSWRNLVPTATAGLGLVSDFRSSRDIGGYQFGTRFAFNMGAGIRWVATERAEIRVDFTDYLYKIEYPALYYSQSADGTQVVPNSQQPSLWTHNVGLTVGAAYRFWR